MRSAATAWRRRFHGADASHRLVAAFVRAFLSGTLRKKMRSTNTSIKGEDEERTYSVEA